MTDLLATKDLELHFPLGRRSLLGPRDKLHAVDGINLRIAAGEAVGLVGESGCGKSTLSRMICRLVDPTAGEILLDGRSITDKPAAAFGKSSLRREIQMVFQDPTESLAPHLTVFELIADPVRRLLGKTDKAALARAVTDSATAVNLPEALLSRYPHQLSGGQKARVGIARAVAVNPRLMVLDEPTSALDVSVQATVLQLLDKLRRERGIALLFVSHDLTVVRLLCQRIAVMYLGQIVEEGLTAQVYDSPRHPYTRALLSAVPTLQPREIERQRLEGEPQTPINPSPTRCRFAGRCPIEAGLCREKAPELRDLGDAHLARCHFA